MHREELDTDTWQATLHIEVFLPAQVPDSELDEWMESGSIRLWRTYLHSVI